MILHRAQTSFFAALLLVWFAPVAQAAHYSGGSLTYECVGGNFYKFKLDLNLDCSGTALIPQSLDFTNDCGVVFSINNVPVVLTEEVSQLCPASLGNSSCHGGALQGLRHYRLETTVYLSPCTGWLIAWDICCRNSTENIFSTPGMYLATTVSNVGGVCDRSPVVWDHTIPFVCVNEPVLYNPGINDPDGNTMAFELIGARFAGPGPMPVVYDAGFSGTQPIPGIVLDPFTGQVSFTPTVTGNYVVVMKVTTYNSTGMVIGTIMRDFIVVVVNCMGEPPQTTGPAISANGTLVGHVLEVCDGVPFCMDFPFSDADLGGVVSLTSNASVLLPGATFTVAGTNPAIGTLCWTPSVAHPKTNVRFLATDNACPIPNIASSSVLITVLEAPLDLPDAGTDGTVTVCSGVATFALFSFLGGDPDTGGTWSYNGIEHGSNYDPGTDELGVYTYTVASAHPCATETATATVTVNEGNNSLILEFQSGSSDPNLVTYEVLDETGTTTILSGNNPVPANSIGTQTLCLSDGCYQLRVTDNAGDGLLGYILRETGANGRRIIDNRQNMITGVSQISNGGAFCVPIGDDTPINSSCDKLDWVTNKFIVANENAAVTAAYATPSLRTSSGYLFWFFDPNGSYSFRRFRKHSESDGYGTGALRANHFRINSWVNTPSSPHLPDGVLLNVRIMGRVNWSWTTWGPACQFKMDAALAACPRVNLQDNLALNEYSCGVNRVFGGSNHWTNRVTASQPQPVPGVSSSLVRYQFRFRIPGEAICIIRPPQTSPRIFMNWSDGLQLECSRQYEVDVRVSLDGGATWCFDVASPSCVEPVTPWGKVCMVNITSSTYCPGELQGGSSSLATQGDGTLTLYPNPNNGEQLFISLTEVGADVNTVRVDIYDLMGKRVTARTIAVADGFVNSAMDVHAIASGMYMVNITVGEKTYTERLVIQR